METTQIALFKGKQIRKVLLNNEWRFVVNDVVEALTDSHDPAQYFKRLTWQVCRFKQKFLQKTKQIKSLY